jgi:CRISPR-associated protein Cmr2
MEHMTDAVLIFTFSPVQSFIAEARRAADLYVGSKVLVHMAKAAARAIGVANLIYPATQNDRLPDDVPNVIVAWVPHDQAEGIAGRAHQALLDEWKRLADTGRDELLNKRGLPHDQTWEDTWARQINNVWQVFWAVAPVGANGYSQAYQTARAALDAVKRSRVFPQVEEPGAKDSLSGAREALHLHGQRAKDYWTYAAERTTAAKLRPKGRERLDAIGAVKRFCELGKKSSVSTSTIASADFRERAKQKASGKLAEYRAVIQGVLGQFLYAPRSHDQQWPYDGDLLFLETLKPKRLEDSYHGVEGPERLENARSSLREVHGAMGDPPSPYYAVVVLDGDGMGRHLSDLLEGQKPKEAHHAFSRQLAGFTKQVPQTLGRIFRERVLGGIAVAPDSDEQAGYEFLIYNGGDDVLALAPLSTALLMARALTQEFKSMVPGCRASAGLAIAHHLCPLDVALGAARVAEKLAKGVEGKAAVAVQIIKRSGETVIMCSKWESMSELFDDLVGHFVAKGLSSRFAYDLSGRARIVTALPADARKATLTQLVKRHKTDQLADPDGLVRRLWEWAQALDSQAPPETVDGADIPQGLAELARWVVFARFVAQGGGE